MKLGLGLWLRLFSVRVVSTVADAASRKRMGPGQWLQAQLVKCGAGRGLRSRIQPATRGVGGGG